MRFGIYTEMQCPPEKPHAQLYWEIQRQIEHADEVGFDVYSTIDHHFSQEFGISGLFSSFQSLPHWLVC